MNEQTIAEACRLLLAPGQVTEVRILHTRYKTVSGYYDNFDKLAVDAAQWSGKAEAVYFLPNVVPSSLLARAQNRLVHYAEHTTSDADIIRRRWLLLDFDPIRPAGISSTEAEHTAAVAHMNECLDWLLSLGFPRALLVHADSGNGAHGLVSLDLPNDTESLALIQRCLAAVDFRFTDSAVKVDMTVFNAARIWKLYGTLAGKGDSISDRPHRMACILDAPDTLAPVSRELLGKLAALAPEAPKSHARQTTNGQGSFDLESWIAAHNLDVAGPSTWKDGHKWIFTVCPWNDSHTNKSAYIIRLGNGALSAGCHHNGCHGKDWHALRDTIEPGWREWWNQNGNGASQGQEHTDQEEEADTTGQHARNDHLTLTSLKDLLQEPEESVAWLLEKILPSGGFSLLVAKPKAGKSTLARNLALSVAQGRHFFGKPTQQGPVIYLALEEKRAEVRKHFLDMGATGEEEIYISAASAPVDALPQIRAIAEEKKPVLIIIDPLFKLTRVKDGNDYAQVTQALEPLLVLARETDAHVLCVHHMGKGEREGGDSILGSTAIFAAVDTALMMKRSERYRTISSRQRYGEDLPETVLRFDPQTRTITLGESKEQEEEQRLADAIVEFLKTQKEPVTEEEINSEVEGRRIVRRRALLWLVKEQQSVERLGKGGKKDPYRYALKDSWFSWSQYTNGTTGPSTAKEEATAQEDESFSWSRDSSNPEDPAKSQDHENEQPTAQDAQGFNWDNGEQNASPEDEEELV